MRTLTCPRCGSNDHFQVMAWSLTRGKHYIAQTALPASTSYAVYDVKGAETVESDYIPNTKATCQSCQHEDAVEKFLDPDEVKFLLEPKVGLSTWGYREIFKLLRERCKQSVQTFREKWKKALKYLN